MRALLATEVFLPRVSGLVTAVKTLAEALRNAGDSVVLACPESSEATRWSQEAGISTYPIPRMKLGAGLALTPPRHNMRGLGDASRFDVVHVHSPGPIGYSAIRLAERHAIPIVGSLHTLPANVLSPFASKLAAVPGMEETIMSLLCRPFHRADAVVAPSEFGARILRERGVGKVHVISNGVLFESGPPMVPRALNKDGQVRCIYVGRLQREKYVAEVIEGVAVAHRLGANVRLTIVGRGPDEHALRKAAARFGIAKEVVFAGYLPPSKLAAARKWATVACIASRHELQCCSALEAMADGLPVLAARCGALPETVPDGHAGLIFEPGAVSDLGQLIYKLGEDATAYGRYSEGALATAAMHSIDKTVKRMRGLYHEVTTSCRTVQAASV